MQEKLLASSYTPRKMQISIAYGLIVGCKANSPSDRSWQTCPSRLRTIVLMSVVDITALRSRIPIAKPVELEPTLCHIALASSKWMIRDGDGITKLNVT